MKKHILPLAFLLMCTGAYSQTSYLQHIAINVPQTEKTADRQVKVSFDADLSDLRMKRQQTFRIVPVLVSEDGSRQAELPAFVINGKVRDKANARADMLNGTTSDGEALFSVRRKNGTEQTVSYEAEIPFKKWMIGSNLQLKGYATGCAGCEEGNETGYLGNVLPPMEPQFAYPFIRPREETVKHRTESRTARLQFHQGSSVIDKRYKRNAAELDEVSRSVALVKENADLTITGIHVTGYASPEGGFDYNMKLSERRAKALVQYMQNEFPAIGKDLYHVSWKGEDWEGLRVELDRHPQQQERAVIKEVIDGCGEDKDACEKQIRATVSPAAYRQLLNEVYPPIRRNEYRIEYDVRRFSLEEGKQMIATRPDLMSVNEIQQVADSYGKGTAKYIECMQAGVKAYPQDITMLNNAALALIEAGRTQEAIALLQDAPADGALQNMLGVAYMKAGDADLASRAFRQAVAAGNGQAQQNLQALEAIMEYYAE